MSEIKVQVETKDAKKTKPAACAVADAMIDAGFELQSANTRTTTRNAIEMTFQKSPN